MQHQPLRAVFSWGCLRRASFRMGVVRSPRLVSVSSQASAILGRCTDLGILRVLYLPKKFPVSHTPLPSGERRRENERHVFIKPEQTDGAGASRLAIFLPIRDATQISRVSAAPVNVGIWFDGHVVHSTRNVRGMRSGRAKLPFSDIRMPQIELGAS